jgi:hypothetical protein
MVRHGLGLKMETKAGSSKHCNELCSFIKCRELLSWLRTCYLVKKKCAAYGQTALYNDCHLLRLYCVCDEWMNECMNMEHWWNYKDENAEVLREKPFPVVLCVPHIPLWLTWDWTVASTPRGWQLSAWAMQLSRSQFWKEHV